MTSLTQTKPVTTKIAPAQITCWKLAFSLLCSHCRLVCRNPNRHGLFFNSKGLALSSAQGLGRGLYDFPRGLRSLLKHSSCYQEQPQFLNNSIDFVKLLRCCGPSIAKKNAQDSHSLLPPWSLNRLEDWKQMLVDNRCGSM